MSDATVQLSVIVVNWNAGEMLARCLDSVTSSAAGLRSEVWLVDNASNDGSAERASGAYPDLTLIRNSENLGFAAAADQALSQATGEYLLLLNPDAQITQASLERLIAVMKQHTRIGIAGCQSVDESGQVAPGYELSYPGQRGAGVAGASAGQITEVAWVSGACLLARRAMVEQIGLLDPDFFMYYEDVDWCYRARQAGWQVVTVLDVAVQHELGGTSARVPAAETARRAAASRLRFYQKHYPPWRAAWLRARLLFANLAGWGLRSLPSLLDPAMRQARQMNWARVRAALHARSAGRSATG